MTPRRPAGWLPEDDDRVTAAADLVGRTGARAFQIGYLHDTGPPGWYAHAMYAGARITAENCATPAEAAELLAVKVLTGAKCKCGKLVQLDEIGALAWKDPLMTDGTRWPLEESAAAGMCFWRRAGGRWRPEHD